MRMPVTLILLGLLCACTATHRQENVAKLVVFGDSLSDQGNMITLLRDMTQLHHLHMTHPPASHDGKSFSNGTLAVEFLADAMNTGLQPAWRASTRRSREARKGVSIPLLMPMLGQPSQEHLHDRVLAQEVRLARDIVAEKNAPDMAAGWNFAVAGAAVAGDYEGLRFELLNEVALDKQVSAYLRRSESTQVRDAVFVIFIGGNDLLNVFSDRRLHSAERRQRKVATLSDTLITSIDRLRSAGARHILIVGPPDISEAPVIHGASIREEAQALSRQFERELGQQLTTRYSPDELAWMPIQATFSELLQAWPETIRHQACTNSIATGHFRLEPFLAHEELAIQFTDGCTQSWLDTQRIPFFDGIHPVEKIHGEIGARMIEKIRPWVQQRKGERS